MGGHCPYSRLITASLSGRTPRLAPSTRPYDPQVADLTGQAVAGESIRPAHVDQGVWDLTVPMVAGVKRPRPLSPMVRAQFARQRTRDTAPEIALRRCLHRYGLRYRVDHKVLPGHRFRADVVFGPSRVAVFVDGCFWHCCPEHGNRPKNNALWWESKLARNVERDAETDRALLRAGWLPVRVWEHEDPTTAAARVQAVVQSRRPTGRHPVAAAPWTEDAGAGPDRDGSPASTR